MRALIKHFTTHPDMVQYTKEGWKHNKTIMTAFPFSKGLGKRCGTNATKVLSPLEYTLQSLGYGSIARFRPVGNTVNLELVDGQGNTRYDGVVIVAHEDHEWFGVALRLACSLASEKKAS